MYCCPKFPIVMGAMLLAASAAFVLFRPSAASAAADKDVMDAVQKIADALKKGDKVAAKKQIDALLKKVDDNGDVMNVLKPRKKDGKGGLGVGKVPGAIQPDGIDDMLMALEKAAPTAATLAKQKDALLEMTQVLAAVADVAKVKLPAFNAKQPQNVWNTFVGEFRSSVDDLATAVKAQNPKDVQSAAAKITATCNKCHMTFK